MISPQTEALYSEVDIAKISKIMLRLDGDSDKTEPFRCPRIPGGSFTPYGMSLGEVVKQLDSVEADVPEWLRRVRASTR